MTATISAWGNSQGLRFPKDIMRELHLSVGDKMRVLIQNQKIILEPIKESRVKYDIHTLVSKIPQNYQPSEQFETSVGAEEW